MLIFHKWRSHWLQTKVYSRNITVKCLWTFGQGRCVVNAGSGSVINPVPPTTTNPQPQPQVWKVSEEGLVQAHKGCSYTMMLMMPRMLQQHSDIKVTDAAGINHIGKVYCGNFDCKTESKADEWNQTPRYSWFLLCYCSVFKSNCWNFWYLLFFNVVCLFVFSIIQIKHSFLCSADD